MIIRALQRADLDQFLLLRRERLEREPRAFGESLAEHDATPPEHFARRLESSNDDQFVIGAFEGANLVGMAGFARNMRIKSRHKAVIWGVYVQPTWRNQGVARGVLVTLLERAKKNPHVEKVMLTVASDQIAARRLYKSLGFEVFGHEKHALQIDGAYVDEDQMVLWLRP